MLQPEDLTFNVPYSITYQSSPLAPSVTGGDTERLHQGVASALICSSGSLIHLRALRQGRRGGTAAFRSQRTKLQLISAAQHSDTAKFS